MHTVVYSYCHCRYIIRRTTRKAAKSRCIQQWDIKVVLGKSYTLQYWPKALIKEKKKEKKKKEAAFCTGRILSGTAVHKRDTVQPWSASTDCKFSVSQSLCQWLWGDRASHPGSCSTMWAPPAYSWWWLFTWPSRGHSIYWWWLWNWKEGEFFFWWKETTLLMPIHYFWHSLHCIDRFV